MLFFQFAVFVGKFSVYMPKKTGLVSGNTKTDLLLFKYC